MSEITKKNIALFFMLCMAVTFVSLVPLHEHEEGLQHCYDHIDKEATSCHETLFHLDSKENNCSHKSHVSNEIEDCDFCKFTSTRRFQFILIENEGPSIIEYYKDPIHLELSLGTFQINRYTQDRAPPFL